MAQPNSVRRLVVFGLTGFVILCAWLVMRMFNVPGNSFQGTVRDLSAMEQPVQAALETHIQRLSVSIGPRNLDHYTNLESAANYIEQRFRALGFRVAIQSFQDANSSIRNIEAIIPGGQKASEIVIVGAHYDSYGNSPGANDNASGIAALLEIGRAFSNIRPDRTLHLVAFGKGEAHIKDNQRSGSSVYVEQIFTWPGTVVAMLNLDHLGYYQPDSQQNGPLLLRPFLPEKADFLMFIGSTKDRNILHQTIQSFRDHAYLPSSGMSVPQSLVNPWPSADDTFRQLGIPAILVTDTGPWRYPQESAFQDTPLNIDAKRLTHAVLGLIEVVRAHSAATSPQ